MKYHTKVGIISIIIILLLLVISLLMSLSGFFPLAYEIYTKGFSILGFIFVGDMVYKWLTYGGKNKSKKAAAQSNMVEKPAPPSFTSEKF